MKTFTLIILCLFPLLIAAQCPPGSVTLTTQAEVDAFAVDYPGCTVINGSLTIGPSVDIVDLDGLSNLEQINVNLYIQFNPALLDLSGLAGLTTIGRDLIIRDNGVLDIIELDDVAGSLSGNLQVENNASLTSFFAPVNLTSVNGDFFIFGNPNMVDLTGLENLTSIGNRFRIQQVLEDDFPDFSNLTHVGSEISIQLNPNVTTLNLPNVTGSLTAWFYVTDNTSLTTLNAPVNLTATGNDLFVLNNPNLVNFTGLENLTSVGNRFRIAHVLEDDFPDFSNLVNVGTDISIQLNPNVTTLNLPNVTGSLTAWFYVTDNTSLTTLNAPVNLTATGNDLFVLNNPNLVNFTGLENLTSVGNRFIIANVLEDDLPDFSSLTFVNRLISINNNPNITAINLQNLGGIIGIGGVSQGIVISQNNSLSNLQAPDFLTGINGILDISFNPNLSIFTGFSNLKFVSDFFKISETTAPIFPDMFQLTSLGDDLILQNNSGVETLQWLSNLSSIGGSIYVRENSQLNYCTINAICDFLAGSGVRVITNNTGCCLNEPILTDACNNPGSGGTEICDGLDNNCDGFIDEGFDQDGDSYTTCQGDCDDGDPAVNPGAEEFCDGIDNNCDGLVDASDPNYIDDTTPVAICQSSITLLLNPIGIAFLTPEVVDNGSYDNCGTVNLSLDEQTFSCIHVGIQSVTLTVTDEKGNFNFCTTSVTVIPASEICDGLDNDCDGLVDEDFDLDGDGFTTCNGECDDSDPSVYLGAPELCDGLDNDCDGDIPADEMDDDGDGFSECGGDCDDTDADNFPGNTEICDGQDNNCDGLIDEGFDQDGDGIADCSDNCPNEPNADQTDSDCDGVGDACDEWAGCDDTLDSDNDGIPNCVDLDELDNWECDNKGKKAYVCHIPPGNPANAYTICISKNAVPPHLNNHGDYIGECWQVSCGGNNLQAPVTGHVLDDLALTEEFFIYPNPANKTLSLDLHHYLGQNISILISDLNGRQIGFVPQQELSTAIVILDLNTWNLFPGIYFISIQNDFGQTVKRFAVGR